MSWVRMTLPSLPPFFVIIHVDIFDGQPAGSGPGQFCASAFFVSLSAQAASAMCADSTTMAAADSTTLPTLLDVARATQQEPVACTAKMTPSKATTIS